MIKELEYHKAKMFVGIRAENFSAVKEYIADQANILLAIGNFFGCYDVESVNDGAHELNKDFLIKRVEVTDQKKNQKLINNG